MTEEQVVSWRAIVAHIPVIASDGKEVGKVLDVAALPEEDIFHGIVVKSSKGGKHFEIPAARIKKITEKHVVTDLTENDVAALQPYREEHWFHIGWGGLFRKHPEWEETTRT